jgi:hypothetical protein
LLGSARRTEGVELDERSLPHGEPYRPLGRRAQIVTILLIIGIGTTVAGVVSGLMERSLLDDVQQGQFITPKQADDNDRRQLLVAMVDGTVFIATGVFFLFWFHRAYRNLLALGGDRRYGTGWAIGSWFVPFLNAWRPKQIVNDIWRESGPRTTDEYRTKDEEDKVPNLFLLWWLAWLLVGAFYWAATRTSWSAVTIDELLAANGLFLAADISSILAAALAVVFVQRATSREQESARLLDLIPDDDRTAVFRRKSTWVVAACLVVGVAIQGGIAVASLSGSLSSESEAEPEPAPGTPAGALVSDDFSTQGAWLVDENPDLTFDYVQDAYRIYLKKPGLWSSIRALPDEVESLTMEADASAEDIDPRADFFGISCLTASGESFLFGMSPDGYFTVAVDPGGDQQLEFQRLIEDSALRRFSTPNAVNRLRAECVRDGDIMKLRFLVNGKRVTETQHESSGRLVGVELFAYSEKGGTDIRFDNVLVRPVPQ